MEEVHNTFDFRSSWIIVVLKRKPRRQLDNMIKAIMMGGQRTRSPSEFIFAAVSVTIARISSSTISYCAHWFRHWCRTVSAVWSVPRSCLQQSVTQCNFHASSIQWPVTARYDWLWHEVQWSSVSAIAWPLMMYFIWLTNDMLIHPNKRRNGFRTLFRVRSAIFVKDVTTWCLS